MEYIFVGKLIKVYRKLKKVTPEVLGVYIGRQRNTILSWESGETFPEVRDVCALAKFFSVHPERFFARVKKPKPETAGSGLPVLPPHP